LIASGAVGSTSVFNAHTPSALPSHAAITPEPPPANETAPLKMSGRYSTAMRETKPPRDAPKAIVR
jgi:hypothetical protein